MKISTSVRFARARISGEECGRLFIRFTINRVGRRVIELANRVCVRGLLSQKNPQCDGARSVRRSIVKNVSTAESNREFNVALRDARNSVNSSPSSRNIRPDAKRTNERTDKRPCNLPPINVNDKRRSIRRMRYSSAAGAANRGAYPRYGCNNQLNKVIVRFRIYGPEIAVRAGKVSWVVQYCKRTRKLTKIKNLPFLL